jgi:hypothetical protein
MDRGHDMNAPFHQRVLIWLNTRPPDSLRSALCLTQLATPLLNHTFDNVRWFFGSCELMAFLRDSRKQTRVKVGC